MGHASTRRKVIQGSLEESFGEGDDDGSKQKAAAVTAASNRNNSRNPKDDDEESLKNNKKRQLRSALSAKKRNRYNNAIQQKQQLIRFNVGGTRYEVSQNLLDQHSDCLLAFVASSRDQNQNDNSKDNDTEPPEIFLERNGHRFQYVLDYMRDGTVNLPASVSKASLIKELEYFGFLDDDHDDGHTLAALEACIQQETTTDSIVRYTREISSNSHPCQVHVEGAGSHQVNGIYSQDGRRYSKIGTWNNGECYKFWIYRWARTWRLTTVSQEANDDDKVKPEELILYTCEVQPGVKLTFVPPRRGWVRKNGSDGSDPAPHLTLYHRAVAMVAEEEK